MLFALLIYQSKATINNYDWKFLAHKGGTQNPSSVIELISIVRISTEILIPAHDSSQISLPLFSLAYFCSKHVSTPAISSMSTDNSTQSTKRRKTVALVDLPDQLRVAVSEYLVVPSRLLLSVVLTAPSSSPLRGIGVISLALAQSV